MSRRDAASGAFAAGAAAMIRNGLPANAPRRENEQALIPRQLVRDGKAEMVHAYLDRVLDGCYALSLDNRCPEPP